MCSGCFGYFFFFLKTGEEKLKWRISSHVQNLIPYWNSSKLFTLARGAHKSNRNVTRNRSALLVYDIEAPKMPQFYGYCGDDG